MIDELRRTIEHLEHEDNKKTEERHKYARDIEQVSAIQVAWVKLPQKNKNQMKMKECWMWNKHLALHSCCPHFQVEEHYKLETKDYLTTIKRLQVRPCNKNTRNKRKQNYKFSPGGKSKVVILTDSSNRTWLGSFRRWVVHRDRPGPQAPGFLLLNL